MVTVRDTLKQHPLLAYYSLAFAISWGSMLAAIGGPAHMPATPDEFQRLLPLAAFALMPGPVIASLIMTGVTHGRAGFRDVVARLLRWRVGFRWYVVALLVAPVSTAASLVVLSAYSPVFVPPLLTVGASLRVLLITIAAGLAGGFLEEIGWTGFAIPALLRRHDAFVTGLITGVLWGTWHFEVSWWGSPALASDVPLRIFVPLYLLTGVVQLTAYRILMVWVYEHTRSLLLATLMHASLIVSTVQTVFAPPTTGALFLVWFVALTLLLCGGVALVQISRVRAPNFRVPHRGTARV